MITQRRKEVARAVAMIVEAKSILETCRDEEQDYFDNMPESFQDGQKGEDAQTAIDALDEAVSQMDDVSQALGDIAG